MTDLAELLAGFRRGEVGFDELLAGIDRLLVDGGADPGSLLEVLARDNSSSPLPPEIHAVLRQRIEQAAAPSARPLGTTAPPDDATVASLPGQAGPRARTEIVPPGEPAAAAAPIEPPEPPPPVAEPVAEPDAPPASPEAAGAGNADPADTEAEQHRVVGVGDTIKGRFRLEELLGSGGMGTVFRAVDERKLEAQDRNPYVAVKVLNEDFRTHPESLITLQREAKKAQSLAHPNIVTVYDFDRDGSTIYMTMEYLAGEPLDKTIKSPSFKGMPFDKAFRIVSDIGKALAFAHDSGIVHSDFKPGNVFLTDSGQVKVIDFGIARAHKRPGDPEADVTRFDPGSLGALTPAYASPEMLEEMDPDPRDDIYALACVTYELLTGRHPFGRMQATEARASGIEPTKPRELSRKQWNGILHGLAFERAKRTPSVQRFVEELAPAGTTAGRLPVLVGGGVAAAVVAAGLGYYLFAVPEPAIETPASRETVAPPPETTEAAPPATETAAVTPPPTETTTVTPPPAETAAVTPPPPGISLAAVLPVLRQAKCSALTASVEGGTVRVEGYAGRPSEVDRVRDILMALPGVAGVVNDARSVGDDKCPLIEAFAPYWAANQLNGRGLSLETRNPDGEYVENELLVVDLRTPAERSYVYVDYYSLDGAVVHMLPNASVPDNRLPANQLATLGEREPFGPWEVSEPFGDEMMVVLSAPEPVFDAVRGQLVENGSVYLPELKRRLRQLAARIGEDRIAADFALISTRRAR